MICIAVSSWIGSAFLNVLFPSSLNDNVVNHIFSSAIWCYPRVLSSWMLVKHSVHFCKGGFT